MRDLMMLGALLLFVPLAILNRRAAYLLWGWTAVLSPIYYLYGFMQSFRFNLLFAVIALTFLIFKPVPNSSFKASPTFVMMLLLLLHSMLSIVFGYPDNPFNEILGTQFFKSMVFCLVMFWFIENRDHMHAFLVMLALGLGFHGVVEGLKVIATAGGHHVAGIPTSMMSDNNHFGVAMVMLVPILFYLTQYSASRIAENRILAGTRDYRVCHIWNSLERWDYRARFCGLVAIDNKQTKIKSSSNHRLAINCLQYFCFRCLG